MSELLFGDNMKRLCGNGRCPRVFLTQEGDFIVQGILVDLDVRAQFDPLENEEVVRLPKDVVRELFQNYQLD